LQFVVSWEKFLFFDRFELAGGFFWGNRAISGFVRVARAKHLFSANLPKGVEEMFNVEIYNNAFLKSAGQ
jgi:hypothetical protein